MIRFIVTSDSRRFNYINGLTISALRGEALPLWICRVNVLGGIKRHFGEVSSAHPEHTNRLRACRSPCTSPRHAHNPVDWYPWGEDAFAKARHENKPIFLSSWLFHLSLVPRHGA